MSAHGETDGSRPMGRTRLLRWIRWTTGSLLIPIILIPIMVAAQGWQLQLVSTAWSPFTNPPGQPRFALDLVETALERAGVIAETVIVDESRLAPSLLNGEFDGSAALWKDPERERALIYSQPYLENRLILVGRKGSDVSATSLADLAGKRVALVAGYAYGEAVETTHGPVIVDSHSPEDSVARLLDGMADYTLMDELVIQHLVKNHGEEARTRLAFGSTPLLTRSLHLAVRRSHPDAESIISRFNAELRGMIIDGSYHYSLQLRWILADVDGDGRGEYVPRDDRIGMRPPEHSYELFAPAPRRAAARRRPPRPPERSYEFFATGRPTTEPGEARRFYFSGNIYDDWSAVPEHHKALDFSGPEPDYTVRLFTFTW